ncbi:MAG: MBL fold metallo-hydrolase [bacterium]|nr:MBL fold metallo-hydrolase [bacterium]
MRITFCGAAGEVTGSCYLLETSGAKILVDCGMFQGSQFADDRNRAAFPFDPKLIDAVLVTHAHLDHVGRLPKLVKEGFRGPIFATAPTAALAKLILEDALAVMRYETEKQGREMFFQEEDVDRAVSLFKIVEYNRSVMAPALPCQGVTATFHDAGHILGSSFIEIEGEGTRIVFSGDLGNLEVPILRPPEILPAVDVLVMESTYGAHLHENTTTRVEKLRALIIRTIAQKGVLLIPAFAIERIQEILYELDELVENKKIPSVSVFLDSPLAIRATEVFRHFSTFYDAEALVRISKSKDLFNFPGLESTLSRDESRGINETPAPKIIIAGAGMMTGGRILHHARRYLKDRNSSILFVGYQAENTLGRAILNGADHVYIYDERVPVRARVEKIGGYSAHADRRQLIAWVKHAAKPPARIFLTHGEEDSRTLMAKELQGVVASIVEKPLLGNSFDL